ncbi:MAG: hypothetical protein CME25_21950 [Gemmatimonadetes bacterium]|nr:hypothetical protein [Gemmatimonadota bacterium]
MVEIRRIVRQVVVAASCRIHILLNVAVMIFVAFGQAFAEELQIQMSVDRTQVSVGGHLNLTVAVSSNVGGISFGKTPEVALPEGFDVAGSSSSTSNSMNIVNGAVTTSVTTRLKYTLRTTKAGSFVLGPLRMDHKGKRYESNKIRVQVSKGQRPRSSGSSGRGANIPDVGSIEEDLFVVAVPDRNNVYVGEQVTLSYKLYTRQNITNVSYAHIPTYTGFWAEPVFDTQRLNFNREIVDGREFHVAPLKVTALFPTTGGKHQLEQLELMCDVPDASGQQRRFDAFGFEDLFRFGAGGRTRKVRLRSADVEMNVLSLPATAPPGFEGAVGQYRISALVSPTTTVEGEPVSMKLIVSGTGNLNAVLQPLYDPSPIFKFYDPKETVEVQKQGTRIGGRKTFEYVVIPQEAGRREIPAFSLTYFNPAERKYHTARTDPIALNVTPGDTRAGLAESTPLSRNEIEVLGQDIRYLKPDIDFLEDHGAHLHESWKFWSINFIPILGFVSALLFKRRQSRLSGDVAYARRRRSSSNARNRLARAKQFFGEGSSGAFYSELNNSLSQFLADRLDVSAAAITPDSAGELLLGQGSDARIVDEVRSLLEQCDYARFSSDSTAGDDRKAHYQQAEELISTLETLI